jgi:hypothetical protein
VTVQAIWHRVSPIAYRLLLADSCFCANPVLKKNVITFKLTAAHSNRNFSRNIYLHRPIQLAGKQKLPHAT